MSRPRDFLRHLHTAVQRLGYRPAGDPLVEDAIDDLFAVGRDLTAATGSAELAVSDPVALDGVVIEGAAIEYGGLLQTLRDRGVEVVTLVAPVERADVAAFALVVAGHGGAPGDTVRLDERGTERPVRASSLNRLVPEALGVLRRIAEDGVRLDVVADVAEPLAREAIADPDDAFVRAAALASGDDVAEHSTAVAVLSAVAGARIGVGRDRIGVLTTAALLHDVALLIEPDLLHRDHPVAGAGRILLAAGPGHEIAAAVALEHHVRPDGTGYPGIGRTPHPFSRIVAAADGFGHLVAGSDTRPPRAPGDALRVLGAAGEIDPAVLVAFRAAFGDRPAGSLLRLDGGEVALVASSSGTALVVSDAEGHRLSVPEPVDLRARTVVAELLPDEAGIDAAELPDLLG